MLGVAQAFCQAVCIGQAAQAEHAAQLHSRDGGHAVARAGGQDQVVVVESVATVEKQLVALQIQRRDAALNSRDAVFVKVFGRAKPQCCHADLAQQIGLGERRALVRNAGLVSDEGDRPVKPFLPQRCSHLIPGLAGADNDDLLK